MEGGGVEGDGVEGDGVEGGGWWGGGWRVMGCNIACVGRPSVSSAGRPRRRRDPLVQ